VLAPTSGETHPSNGKSSGDSYCGWRVLSGQEFAAELDGECHHLRKIMLSDELREALFLSNPAARVAKHSRHQHPAIPAHPTIRQLLLERISRAGVPELIEFRDQLLSFAGAQWVGTSAHEASIVASSISMMGISSLTA
jgi:hypothetical protein